MFTSPSPYDGFIRNGAHHFPDPFLDMASLATPRSMSELLLLSEFLWVKNGTYSAAAGRIVRYFVTEVEFDKPDVNLSKCLTKDIRAEENLVYSGDNVMAYGNDFTTMIRPFRRFLACNRCHSTEVPIDSARWRFSDFRFFAYCHRCRQETRHSHVDRRSQEQDKFWIKHWSPHEMLIRHHPYSGSWRNNEYFWRISADLKNEIRKGTPFYVKSCPWEIIETIRRNELFQFAPDMLYHMFEPSLAGIRTAGWGLPRMLSNFSQAWYTQVLKRFNEALAQDYIIPFRTLTPEPVRSGASGGLVGADPVASVDMGQFTGNVRRMLSDHRKDPARWHVLPFPIKYQALGGEAKALAPKELLDQGTDEFLNGIGIPANLYRFDLQMQMVPSVLRLFQQNWVHLVNGYNGWVEWVVEQLCTTMNWDKPESARLRPTRFADDLEVRNTLLQLASSNMVSRDTAFHPLGIKSKDEQRKIFQEQEEFEEDQRKYQERAQQREALRERMAGGGQQGGPQAMGGAAGAGGAQGAMTPADKLQQAQELAQEWASMPQAARTSEMRKVKSTDQVLWSLAKAQLQTIRQDAEAQGRQQLEQR